MIFKKSVLNSRKHLWMAIVLLTMVACNNIYDKYDNEECSANDVGTFVSLTINTASMTRATPTGGENGDAQEDGQTNENTISDLTVFFYQGTDINQAISTNANISGSAYFESSDIIGNTTKARKVELPKGVYHVIVIANAGDLTSTFGATAKVKDVCDYLQKKAWTDNGTTYSQFVMSSAKDASVSLTIAATNIYPAQIYVDIERVAARVDFIPNKGTDATELNNYLVKDGSNNTIARVIINKIKLINRFTAGSYLVKRVAASTSAPPLYLGDEEPVAGGVQTNYVIDPWSNIKTKNNLTGQHFSLLNGSTGTDIASSLYANYYSSNFALSSEDALKNANLTKDGVNYYILGYTLENTTDKDNQLNGYATGVMFETTYIPYKVTSYNATSRSNIAINNSNAITFFTYNNGKVICNSLETIEFASLKSTQPTDEFFAPKFTPANTWQEILEYTNRIKDNDLLGFKNYLLGKLNGQSMTDHLTESISWSSFALTTYGYSINGGVLTINQNGINTKLLLSQTGIKCYENGLCYYPYWIRHSNNGTTDSGIMEFGIVRNNIYKLKVNSFSGAGKPVPYDPVTDKPENPAEESSVSMLVTVTPWRVISHPEIIL